VSDHEDILTPLDSPLSYNSKCIVNRPLSNPK